MAAAAGAPLAAPYQEAVTVGTMQNEFALDLYRRLAAEKAGDNLFFSPYSVYAALAMTAEGARGATADEMGRALRLPPTLRRQGGEAASRPWDFTPVHEGIGAIAEELRRGAGVAPGIEARIDALRQALAEADADAQQVLRQKDWKDLFKKRDLANSFAAELNAFWKDLLEKQDLARSLAAELNASLSEVDRYELSVANALWTDTRYTLAPDFVQTISAHYGTDGARAVDYRNDPDGARGQINAWAADQTRNRIQDVLPRGAVGPLTRLVLANAIWFKGAWSEVFDPKTTLDAPFAGDSAARVPLMHREVEGAGYAAFRADGAPFSTPREVGLRTSPADPKLYPGAGGFQVAELPYKGEQLRMVILLPHSTDGLAALEHQLDAERLGAWIGRLAWRKTDVYLPRFRLEQGRDLREPLETMGMKQAFAEGRAQFDGMTNSVNPADALYLSGVLHKAFLDVNEEGTEAAAAMAVDMAAFLAPSTRQFVPIFRADRPFLFLIRDVASGAILFMGRFAKP